MLLTENHLFLWKILKYILRRNVFLNILLNTLLSILLKYCYYGVDFIALYVFMFFTFVTRFQI